MESCPHCESAPIAVIRRVWFLRSFVLFARYGTHFVVGCNECARHAILQNLWINTIGGWWSVPWGLGTPVVIAQNLLQLITRSEEVEQERLNRSGLHVGHSTT
jgi:hypothetical protein